jgi:hypothetical protein
MNGKGTKIGGIDPSMNEKEKYHAAYAAMEKAGAVSLEAGKRAAQAKEKGGQEYQEAKQEFEEAYQVYYNAVELANATRAAAYDAVFESIRADINKPNCTGDRAQ